MDRRKRVVGVARVIEIEESLWATSMPLVAGLVMVIVACLVLL